MEMDNPVNEQRRQVITSALNEEIDRQAHSGATRLDVEALAEAVEHALEPGQEVSEGKRPSELNATNDD